MVPEQEQQEHSKKGAGLPKPPRKPASPVPKKADQKEDEKKVRYQDHHLHDDKEEEMTMVELESSFDKTRRNRLELGNSSSNLNFDFSASYSCSDGGIGNDSSTFGLLGLQKLDLSSD